MMQWPIKYYARFYIKHEDDSDSYLRKSIYKIWIFIQMETYVKEKTDWLLMSKLEEEKCPRRRNLFTPFR